MTRWKTFLPNYLGKTSEVEAYVLEHDIDEIYCTLPGTKQRKDRTASEFRWEEDGALLYRARVLPGCKEEYGDGGDGIDPIADGPPGALQSAYNGSWN